MKLLDRMREQRHTRRAEKNVQLVHIGPRNAATRQALAQARQAAANRARAGVVDDDEGFPVRAFPRGGERFRDNLTRPFRLRPRLFAETAFSAATAFPFVAGASLGTPGAYIGDDVYGGGAFNFDPWELYEAGLITGMSMIIVGAQGTGKSTCAKSLVSRLVLHGRRALVLADRKGEWDAIAEFLDGGTIHVGAGLNTRVNPLDSGRRPSTGPRGTEMTDELWAAMVRSRRLTLLITLAEILENRRVEGPEHTALARALDTAVADAVQADREPIITDVVEALETITNAPSSSHTVQSGADALLHAFNRLVNGDLAGMFDGPSTVRFDPTLPIITVNTSGTAGMTEEARRITYACTGAWAESMITNADSGHRVCVYEEGWDSMSDPASLRRMVEAWKLARDYDIYNVLIMHKLGDLDIGGDAGSAMAAMARSLLGDTETKVIYRQEIANLAVTQAELGLTDAELKEVRRARMGRGLWKVGARTFSVQNHRTSAEIAPFNTNTKMGIGS